jgi:hypothetical protein
MGIDYPPVLNDGKGCLFGKHMAERLKDLEERMKCFDKKLSKILWALVSFTIALASAAVMLGVNLATRLPAP